MNNSYQDKRSRYEIKPVTLEVIDTCVFDYYNKRLDITVDSNNERVKVPVMFATGERWALIKNKKAIRDENGTLILPLITVKRDRIDRTPGFGGLAQEVSSITIEITPHKKTSILENAYPKRKADGFPDVKPAPVVEYLTIPYPDFCIIYYEISIWAQYQTQMNEIIEKIFYNYDHMDSFVMPVEYDGHKRKGNSYYFVGFREGINSQSNFEEFTDQERIIKYSYTIKTPAYLMLDPKDEALSYGKNRGNTKSDDGSKIVYKSQNSVDIKLGESVISAEEFEKLFG